MQEIDRVNHSSKVPEHRERARLKNNNTGNFFRELLLTVPSVWGLSGPEHDEQQDQAEEIAYTRRCRELSTYTQISVLLSTCQLSRLVAQRHMDKNCEYSWHVFRSMGPLYRARPMRVWEDQYHGNRVPQVPDWIVAKGREWEILSPRIHELDIAVLRLHDSQGRPTHMLRHGPWQYDDTFSIMHRNTCAELVRIGIEWHPRWGTPAGREDFCESNVKALVQLTSSGSMDQRRLYWLVDGIPRPNWKHDYPAVVEAFFEQAITTNKWANKVFLDHWQGFDEDERKMLADLHLHQEFETNGRRYYVVFVVVQDLAVVFDYQAALKRGLDDAGLGHGGPYGPFPGGEDIWPEALRAPAWFAYHTGMRTRNLSTLERHCYILSWEPI